MTATQLQQTKLVYTMAHALRHDPASYGLEPDKEGWVSLNDLIIALRFQRNAWMNLGHNDIMELLAAAAASDRFEIRGAKIRAAYGHSISLATPPAPSQPPEFLYHGTAEGRIAEIMAKGLLRMGRQFVHLSSDIDWVRRFVASKERWGVFRILARTAHQEGVVFRQANQHVWLADSIEPRFLQTDSSGISRAACHDERKQSSD